MCKKKVPSDLGLDRHTVLAVGQPSFHLLLPKKAVPRYRGVEGSKSKHSLGDNVVFQNDNI